MSEFAQIALPAEGSVGVWCGPAQGPPVFARHADATHYAASIAKLPVMLALYAAAQAGELALEDRVDVHDRFLSGAGGTFRAEADDDNDRQPWHRLGERVELRWLCERMIVSSSNLASNVLLEHLGLPAVAAQCPPGMSVGRQIGDSRAAAAGLTNRTSAAATAALLGRLAAPADQLDAALRLEMTQVLRGQLHDTGIPAGLPAGTAVASKAGWVDGVRHDAAIVSGPEGSYVLAVCTSGLADDAALSLIRSIARASWPLAELTS